MRNLKLYKRIKEMTRAEKDEINKTLSYPPVSTEKPRKNIHNYY